MEKQPCFARAPFPAWVPPAVERRISSKACAAFSTCVAVAQPRIVAGTNQTPATVRDAGGRWWDPWEPQVLADICGWEGHECIYTLLSCYFTPVSGWLFPEVQNEPFYLVWVDSLGPLP